MGKFVVSEVVKLMIKKGTCVKSTKVLLLGITFKENCPDIRNTKAIDIYNELVEYGMEVDVYDPWAKAEAVKHEYNIDILKTTPKNDGYKAIILAVAHKEFLNIDIQQYKDKECIIYDVKGMFNRELVDGRL